MEFDHNRARERHEELERQRKRRERRDELRRVHRRRRLTALGIVCVPVGLIALATTWPQSDDRPATSTTATTATQSASTAKLVDFRTTPPKEVRGIYISLGGVELGMIPKAVEQADPDGLNAVVLDVRNERGQIAFPDGMPELARKVGATGTFYDPKKTVNRLHKAGIWVIARVVAFNDPLLSRSRQALAIHHKAGGIWKDQNGLSWLNPYSEGAWRYAIDIAKAAADAGFDEIQFDYVRFPTDGDVQNADYGKAATGDTVATITSFLKQATFELHQKRVHVAADIFGVASWPSQTKILGQKPLPLARVLDVVSPMVYASLYSSNPYGVDDPVANPGEIVFAATTDWYLRTKEAEPQPAIRPWIQDYGGYGPGQVRDQIFATRKARASGFMLWNAAMQYSSETLVPTGI